LGNNDFSKMMKKDFRFLIMKYYDEDPCKLSERKKSELVLTCKSSEVARDFPFVFYFSIVSLIFGLISMIMWFFGAISGIYYVDFSVIGIFGIFTLTLGLFYTVGYIRNNWKFEKERRRLCSIIKKGNCGKLKTGNGSLEAQVN